MQQQIPVAPAHAVLVSWLRVTVLWASGVLAAMQFAKMAVTFQTWTQTFAVSAAQTGWLLSAVGTMGLVFGVTMGLWSTFFGVAFSLAAAFAPSVVAQHFVRPAKLVKLAFVGVMGPWGSCGQ